MALRIGRYLLHDEIASGGMAAVHFGRLVGTGGFAKTVAIKRLHKKLAREDAFRTMILEEARLAARIRHPNVVPPLDVLSEGSELLLVMEYVHGEALSKLLRSARESGERVPVAVAAAILTNVLHGLHAAHEARGEDGEPLSIVHRDVSPQNVIVGVDGVARVIDFGIAKAVTSNETTKTGTVKGKLPYLSPEQLEGEPVTRRTDVYAAGIVLWEVLTTKRLFEGADDSAVLRNILAYQPPPPSLTNPNVPALIDEIALRALSKKPAERFATAREMALAIEDAIVIATPSVVGAWAERLAEKSLARRAELIARLEQSDHDEVAEEAPPPSRAPISRKPASLPSPPSRPPASAPARPMSTSRAPPKTTLTRPIPVETVALAPEIQEDVIANTETREISLSHAISIEPLPPPVQPHYAPSPYIIVEPEMPAAPVTPQRTIGASLPVYREPDDSSKKPFAYFLVAAALFLLMFATPFLLSRAYVAIAARHGFVLTIEHVEVSRRSLRLVDVRMTTPEVPGAALSAHSVTLAGFLRPSTVTFDDALLELDGRVSDVWSHVDALRDARGPAIQYLLRTVDKVSVASGRVVWKDAIAKGTELHAENASLDAPRVAGRPLLDDVRALFPLVNVKTGNDVLAGPWLVEVERRPPLTRALFRFDTQGSYVGRMTWSFSDDGAVSASFAVPPASPGELRIPRSLLPSATDATRIELGGEISFLATAAALTQGGPLGAPSPGGTRAAQGRVVFALGRAAPFPGGAPVDLAIDVSVTGDPAKVMPLSTSSLSLGPTDPSGKRAITTASARLTGTLDTTTVAPRIVLHGTTTPLPCEAPKAGASPLTTLTFDANLVLDDIRASTLTLDPSSPCAPRLR